MYDEEIEKAVLYYIIYEGANYEIREDDFINDRNKKIAKAINDLKAKKEDISMLTVKSKIKANSKQVLEYITTLGNNVYGTNIDDMYKKLIQLSQKRKIFELAKNIMQNIENEDIEVYAQTIIRNINDISDRNYKEDTFSQQVLETMEQIENNWKKRNDKSLYTGFFDLDKKICGLHNQELTIIGARPGIGKTTLALQIAQKIAKKKNVLYISLEMSEIQLIQKMIAKEGNINTYKMRMGTLGDNDFIKITQTANDLLGYNLMIDTKIRNIQQIEVKSKKLKNQNKLDLVIIDYIQLLKSNEKYNIREQEVADISRRLKLLSLEIDVPIIALCQLNRNANNNEPTLADLRESGSLEQDADNIIFLYYGNDEEEEKNIVTLKLAKQRAGEIGKMKLEFDKKTSNFKNLYRG